MNDSSLFELVQEFFMRLGVTYTELTVVTEGTDIQIRIQTTDSPLLIGTHGRGLESIQHLLGRMIEKTSNTHPHVHLEVNDYIKEKEARLYGILEHNIKNIMRGWKDIHLTGLSSYERKKAHNYIALKNIPGLSTHSEWLWEERILILTYTGELQALPTIPKIAPQTTHDLSEDGIGI